MLEPSRLKDYENNARTHSKTQIEEIIKSIRYFGFNVPIEVNTSFVILSGHARVRAAKKMGLKEIPVIIQHHLVDPAKQDGYILAANKIAMNAEWDFDILSERIHVLNETPGFDLSSTGFSKLEIDELLGKMDFQPGTLDAQGSLDVLEPKLVICPHCEQQFDLRDLD
jgi:ParB-like chromosome segregation protein Spo0J